MKKYYKTSVGDDCKHCKKVMERRYRTYSATARGWYLYWDVCDCGMIQHYDSVHYPATKTVEDLRDKAPLTMF